MPDLEDTGQPEQDTDTLMGRIVDREASSADFARFEEIAAADGDLWRSLALRQIDMAALGDCVTERLEAADRVEVTTRRRLRTGPSLLIALTGWAAVLVVAAWWAVAASGRPAPGPVELERAAGADGAPVRKLTAQEHYAKYLESASVVGELDPILLSTEPLDDGRYRIRFVRRIEEVSIIDAPPIDPGDPR